MEDKDFLMRFFEYSHLPSHLQEISKRFYELANYIDFELPMNQEREVALRKLLEAKDCAVRAGVVNNLEAEDEKIELSWEQIREAILSYMALPSVSYDGIKNKLGFK